MLRSAFAGEASWLHGQLYPGSVGLDALATQLAQAADGLEKLGLEPAKAFT